MKGFDFDQKPAVKICGKEYECDASDNGLIDGTARDFPRILALAQELTELKDGLGMETTEEAAKSAQESAVRINTDLTLACRDFIVGCLGEDAYQEIFSRRRPNSTEHVKLCAYLYGFIIDQRGRVLKEYLDPPKEVRHAAGETAPENP